MAKGETWWCIEYPDASGDEIKPKLCAPTSNRLLEGAWKRAEAIFKDPESLLIFRGLRAVRIRVEVVEDDTE